MVAIELLNEVVSEPRGVERVAGSVRLVRSVCERRQMSDRCLKIRKRVLTPKQEVLAPLDELYLIAHGAEVHIAVRNPLGQPSCSAKDST